ncbi:ATP-binding cassette domain-containing protein [Agrococcus versicolor]|uniref:ATP-binding cassette domain-containing protein n=1 Tax=Agrococcus versicolor TaxID=501482 RepID=A0ABN3AP52_9MICO
MSAALEAHVVVDRGGFRLDATLEVAAGEIVAVMGPSGAGKSTLLGALAGLVRPTSGRIRVGDRTVDEPGARRAHVPPMRRGVVLLGQEPRLFPHLTAAQNVAFSLRARGIGRAQARAEASAWLDRVRLAELGTARPAALSGGQQQRVALARALAAAPSIVLLDEPLTSLDAETAADVRTLLVAELAASGTTAVLVTHDAVDAVALAARLVVLEDGRVTQVGATRDVLSVPATRFAAALAGLDRLEGVASGGAFVHDVSGLVLQADDAASVAAAAVDGTPLVAVLPPSAVRIDAADGATADAGAGSDAWRARVVRLEATVGGVRVVTTPVDADGRSAGAQPGPRVDAASVSAEVPVAAMAELALAPGDRVVLRIDRRHVRLLRR